MSALPAVVTLQAEPGGFDPSFFLMMGSIFLIFYFLVMRPQQKRQKEQEELLKSAVKGDQVITTGWKQPHMMSVNSAPLRSNCGPVE